MTTDSLLVSTIIVLVVGYSQLVVSHTSELETLFSCVNKLGTDSSHPAKSCREIYNYNMASRGQSGYYWIKTDKEYRVYCDMELTCGGITGGWMRIANIDTTQGDDCPSGWSKITQPRPLCRGSGDAAGCYSAYFSNNKAEYNTVCGKLRGYQKGSSDGFHTSSTIDQSYLEGISITVGNPRKHVWSYAVGYNHKAIANSCPCSSSPEGPPTFVKEHYYCESGGAVSTNSHSVVYESDPLWDGRGCPSTSNCCSALGAPWFYRHFTEPEGGAVEVRICRNEAYSNEATLLDQVELYIQ